MIPKECKRLAEVDSLIVPDSRQLWATPNLMRTELAFQEPVYEKRSHIG